MPTVVRLKAKIVALVFIAFAPLRSTIAKPTELGEGESSSDTNDFDNPTGHGDSYFNQHRNGYYPASQQGQYANYHSQFQRLPQTYAYAPQFQQITDGSNVQINYNDEKVQQSLIDSVNTQVKDDPFTTSGQKDDEMANDGNLNRRFFNDDLNKMLQSVNNRSEVSDEHKALNNYNREEIKRQSLIQSPSNRKIEDSIQLVRPKYVVLTPINFRGSYDDKTNNYDLTKLHLQHDPKDAAVIGKQKKQNHVELIEEESYLPSMDEGEIQGGDWGTNGENNQGKKKEGLLRIPTQDVGEYGEHFGNENEDMKAASSNNIAYSYSQFVPNYRPAPARYSENNNFANYKAAPMSIVFHPNQLGGNQPELVLHELKAFALQLAQSPYMNAMFSPASVPIPTSPPWPSRYEAKKYLPPGNLVSRVYKSPSLRRALIQVNTDGLSPDMLERLHFENEAPSRLVSDAVQEYLGPNFDSFDQFMGTKMQVPQEQTNQAFNSASQIFNRGSQAFEASSGALNNFFNNQLQLPQFPNFPSFSTQYQYRGYVAPSVRGITPNAPNLRTFPVPYISPSLRNVDLDPTDDIDVRMDTRSDSINRKNSNSQNRMQIVQIGTGNKNVNDVVQSANDEDQEDREQENENDEVEEQMVTNEGGGMLKQEPITEPVKTDVNSDTNISGITRDRSSFVDAEIGTTMKNDDYADPSSLDVITSDDEEGMYGEEETKEKLQNTTKDEIKIDELPIMNQQEMKANKKVEKSEDGTWSDTTVQMGRDEHEEATTVNREITTQPIMFDETTNDKYLQTESIRDDATTTDALAFETTMEPFSLDNRLDPNAIRTLAG